MNTRPEDPLASDPPLRDARALPILAKTIYRELRQSGLSEEDIMSVAGELLAHVAGGLRARATTSEALAPPWSAGAAVRQP